jgi:aryl-alcohol dehydrogenase-like predicted oxidoreductase
VVTYSSIAQGILTGKFGRDVSFPEGDNRRNVVWFDDAVWPHVYEGTERLKAIAERAGRPLTHLAIQWVARQPGVTSVLLGARNADQVRRNAAAMGGPVGDDVLTEMSAVGAEVMSHIPDTGNIFRYYP